MNLAVISSSVLIELNGAPQISSLIALSTFSLLDTSRKLLYFSRYDTLLPYSRSSSVLGESSSQFSLGPFLKYRFWKTMTLAATMPETTYSRVSCWVVMQMTYMKTTKTLLQNRRKFSCTWLWITYMRKCVQRFFLSFMQRKMRTPRIMISTRGVWKLKKVIRDQNLKVTINLNSMGQRGYSILACSNFWQPMGRDQSSTAFRVLFQRQYMISRLASNICMSAKLMVWLVMHFSTSPLRSFSTARQMLGMKRQKRQWKAMVVITMKTVLWVQVFGKRSSDSLSMIWRKIRERMLMISRITNWMIVLRGQCSQSMQIICRAKKSIRQKPPNATKKQMMDFTFTLQPSVSYLPRLFHSISSGLGQAQQQTSLPQYLLLKKSFRFSQRVMLYLWKIWSRTSRVWKTRMALRPQWQYQSSCCWQNRSNFSTSFWRASCFLGSDSIFSRQYFCSFYWQAEQNGSIFFTIKPSFSQNSPNYDRSREMRSSRLGEGRFLKSSAKCETPMRSGQRTLNHRMMQSEAIEVASRIRKTIERSSPNLTKASLSPAFSIRSWRSELVMIHSPNKFPQTSSLFSLSSSALQQCWVRYCRQMPQMAQIMATTSMNNFSSQKQLTMAPPQSLKSRQMDRFHQLVKGLRGCCLQQGQGGWEGSGLPGMVQRWWSRASQQSGGYLQG